MNNQNQFGQQSGRPVPPPPPGAPIPPRPPVGKNPFQGENILVLVGTILSFASIALGIASVAMSLGVYDLIINIVAILMGGAGAALSIIGGNQNMSKGAPRGILSTLGFIFGVVGVLVGLAAIGYTSWLTCTYCKAKSYLGI